jgi:hypothetical protein
MLIRQNIPVNCKHSYIHPSEEVEQLIQSLVKGVDVKCDPVMWQSLHNNIPVLFTLLENSCGSSAPAELRPLLEFDIYTFYKALDQLLNLLRGMNISTYCRLKS